jgi:hypothetical protein
VGKQATPYGTVFASEHGRQTDTNKKTNSTVFSLEHGQRIFFQVSVFLRFSLLVPLHALLWTNRIFEVRILKAL